MAERESSLERFAAAVLAALDAPDPHGIVKQALEQLDPAHLPLQAGLAGTSYATDTPVTAMILRIADTGSLVRIRAGLFYGGILAGCSCADDPTPVQEQHEYCEIGIEIDKATGTVCIALIAATDD
jgi:hypothetical protein